MTKDKDNVNSDDKEQKHSQRRINKPLIEKRRRARINECLSHLKAIVLEANNSQSPRPSKLEKADILEMTVDFIKKRQVLSDSKARSDGDQNTQYRSDGDQNTQYSAGYTSCLEEIIKFLEDMKPEDIELKNGILRHVSSKRETLRSESVKNHQMKKQSSEISKSASEISEADSQSNIDVAFRNSASRIPITSTEKGSDKTKLTSSQAQMIINSPSANRPQAVPVSVISGGQVLLLVQLPSSEQIFTQNVLQPHYGIAMVTGTPVHAFNTTCVNTSSLGQQQSTLNNIITNSGYVFSTPLVPAQISNGKDLNLAEIRPPTHWRPW